MQMHPAFLPMQAFVFWLDLLMLPWKMMMAPMADSMKCNSGRHKSGCYGRPRPGNAEGWSRDVSEDVANELRRFPPQPLRPPQSRSSQ